MSGLGDLAERPGRGREGCKRSTPDRRCDGADGCWRGQLQREERRAPSQRERERPADQQVEERADQRTVEAGHFDDADAAAPHPANSMRCRVARDDRDLIASVGQSLGELLRMRGAAADLAEPWCQENHLGTHHGATTRSS